MEFLPKFNSQGGGGSWNKNVLAGIMLKISGGRGGGGWLGGSIRDQGVGSFMVFHFQPCMNYVTFRVIIGHINLNINSVRNKFEPLKETIKNNRHSFSFKN